jgi:formylglycine-generating enzyme required for sulfatase activity
MEFVWCPPGEFMMGSPPNEERRFANESQHKVVLTQGFWLGKCEVTQDQWRAVMGSNPSHFEGSGSLPVDSVIWDDCQGFISKLNERTGNTFRLPTESEWEYACRAGSSTVYCFGNDASGLDAYAWHGYTDGTPGNSDDKTHEVGGKKPNAWGLCDVHGNVQELCQDWMGKYPADTVTDPKGVASGRGRVARGGSYTDSQWTCRAACRTENGAGRFKMTGLRLVLVPKE